MAGMVMLHANELTYKGNTVIGNDVWIGHGATIMPDPDW